MRKLNLTVPRLINADHFFLISGNQIKKMTTATITPTKIIATSKSSPTTNVVKKLNSVIISDNSHRENSPLKSTTIKMENSNNNENHKTTSLGGYSNIILKNKTNTANITNTTSKAITRQIPLAQTNVSLFKYLYMF